jgi:hypothetical protein
MDCSFADDCQRVETAVGTRSSYSIRSTADVVDGGTSTNALVQGDDVDEQVGRYCPIQDAAIQDLTFANQTSSLSTPYAVSGLTSASGSIYWRYHFATRLFDYLTVQGPSDDYLPMNDPNLADVTLPAAIETFKYPHGNAATDNPVAIAPVAIQNSLIPSSAADHTSTTGGTENRLPVDGLININTAPWYVLAQLPLLPPSSAGTPNANGIPANIETLAKAIVTYRESNGGRPFTSIFDLNNYFASSAFNQATVASGGTDWDTSPNGTQVPNDFKKKYLMLTRISNLVTTRSDSFTVFIVVDGFRGAGTNNPQLVVHRRAALIVDRSEMTPETGSGSNKINVVTQ